MSVEPADPRIEAAARAWVGTKSDGTNPMDTDDEFSRHNRIRMAKALAAADAVITPPPDTEALYHALREDSPDFFANRKATWELSERISEKLRAAVVSPPPSDATAVQQQVGWYRYLDGGEQELVRFARTATPDPTFDGWDPVFRMVHDEKESHERS